MKSLSTAASFLCLSLLAACGQAGEEEESNNLSLFSGQPKKEIGQFFMIEHFGIIGGGYQDVHGMISGKNLGAMILWNPDDASGSETRKMIASYSETAGTAGNSEVFYSVDQEEASTQRFWSRHGFSDLAAGAALGLAVARTGNARACELHARISATRPMGFSTRISNPRRSRAAS